VTRLMLDHGADVNARDDSGATPLHEAVRQGKIELVKEFVARGADVNARTERVPGSAGAGRANSGLTPFLVAAQSGNVAMMNQLIALGADPKAKSLEGSNAVLLAAGSKKLEAVRMLVELGLNVNDAPKGRPSALHTAVRSGSDDIVEYLAAHGADLHAKDAYGRTPLEEAEFEAPPSTVELMKKLMARSGN